MNKGMCMLVQERISVQITQKIFRELVKCTGHLHAKGKIHADIKPLNVVRAFDESITLIDLDMAVPLGSPVGAKQLSTAFVGPETTNETVDADGSATAEFRKVTRTLSLTLTLSAALTLTAALTQGGRLRERCGEDTAQGPGRRELQRGGQGHAHN